MVAAATRILLWTIAWFGFASVLTDFGLSSQSFVAGLIGFNIGVELGQLAVIIICFALFGFGSAISLGIAQ